MRRRPPTSTLFPYNDALPISHELPFLKKHAPGAFKLTVPAPSNFVLASYKARSEEHTSELQSHSDLVCRLLPEKKKHSRRRRSPARSHLASRYHRHPSRAPTQ